ncbi:PA2779 family protein [Leptothrix discophora]|uniref:PA2779 family protein n=1 Tax=Leptothrix discophora TaxID=89 RepID=A0ABT9G2F6_LEPDI|nr:PA2779 family protein [Leptothrix discophora]MDP4300642.1 PA2779 family protein [Leptothrix discophora]
MTAARRSPVSSRATPAAIARRRLAGLLAVSLSFGGIVGNAQAGMVDAESLARAEAQAGLSPAQRQLLAAVDRAEVAQALVARGVDPAQARLRIAALSDEQAQALAAEMDRAPAGADGVLDTLVFIFLVLLVTDILGFTKVFPFTRSIR